MQGIFRKENTDKALKYGIYRHLPTYEKIIRNLVSFYIKSYKKMKNTLLIGIGLSLFIEIAQLFTLYRATDINDLLTNVMGTFIGYLCSKWILSKREGLEAYSETTPIKRDCTVYVPIIIIAVTSILGFFS